MTGFARKTAPAFLAFAAAVPGTASAYQYDPQIAYSMPCPPASCRITLGDDGTFVMFDLEIELAANGVARDQLPRFTVSDGFGSLSTLFEIAPVENGYRLVIYRDFRSYGSASGVVPYPVTDLFIRTKRSPARVWNAQARFYISRDQMWIEIPQGASDLANVVTLPIFFGLGHGDTDWVEITRAPSSLNFVEGDGLLASVNSEYAKMDGTTPFLFSGSRRQAAALLSAAL